MTSMLHDDPIPQPRAPVPLAVEDFLATMPAAYLDRFSEADARVHAGIVLRRQGSIHLELCDDAAGQPNMLCVVTNHLPGLMRAVAAVITSHSLNILDKTFYCRSSLQGWNEALAFFRIAPLSDGPTPNDELVASLKSTIIDVLKGKIDIGTLSRRSTPTWRPPAPSADENVEPEPPSERLSQIQMTEPPPASQPRRFSTLPQRV